MHKGAYFALIVAAVGGAYAIGRVTRRATDDHGSGGAKIAAGQRTTSDGVDRVSIPLEGQGKGPADALVNIVEFSDFQCPFCSRVVPTVDRLVKEYPGKIRVFFRHYPLPFHQDAPLASQAALAAGDQGKFWEMHDKLFANQQALKRDHLDKYAQELGLDMGKFKQALDSNKFKAQIDADMAIGSQVGVQGTPATFINGRLVSGAQPYEEFKKVVDDEITRAQKLVAKGVNPARLYAELFKNAAGGAQRAPSAAPNQPAPGAAPVIGNEAFKVAVGQAPTKGGKEPKVTVVTFSEFQCPFCGRIAPTLKQIVDTYKDDVQIAFKHLPLPMHQNAEIAAQAAEAAREQGKFWEMHDKMFANQQAIDRPNLEKYAQELGLDMAKFKAFLDGGKAKERIDADKAEATKYGARGTPTSYVNGRKAEGALPFESFKKAIEEEIKKADEKLKAGVARKNLYAELTKDALAEAKAPPQQPGAPAAGAVQKVDIKGAPVKGAAKDALVTIVQFSDFQCPFCSRVEPTMDKILEEYKGKVRVVWRDFPLDFHQDAMPAAIVAREAGAQGKFWEMHKKLFENQRALDRASLEKYAQELGLNVSKVKAALDGKKYEADIKNDQAMGQKVGVTGTPASFVNGRMLSGAQPFEGFKGIIDEEVRKAEALVKKGVAKSKVYDELMKAAAAAPAAAAAAPADPNSPEGDPTVHKVEVGKSFAKGPKNAPLTVIVFSDFQCPFCSRVEPTLSQLEKEYKGKVRFVWKNLPLPFHNNAKPAAMAAMAAGDQGKFWEMHDKLFANQQSLDRPSLEKYAQELGLDMGKFKAAMDNPKISAQIDAEMKEAQALGVDGTPATFINGRKIHGAFPFDTFKKVAEQELAKTKKKS